MERMITRPPPTKQYLDRDGRFASHIPPATLADQRWLSRAPEPAIRLQSDPARVVERVLPDGTRVRIVGEEPPAYSHVCEIGPQQPHAVERVLMDGTRVHTLASPVAHSYHPHQLHHPHPYLVGRSASVVAPTRTDAVHVAAGSVHAPAAAAMLPYPLTSSLPARANEVLPPAAAVYTLPPTHSLGGLHLAPSAPLPAPKVIHVPAGGSTVMAAHPAEIIRVPAAPPAALPPTAHPPVHRVHPPTAAAPDPRLAQFHAAAWWNYQVASALAAAAGQVGTGQIGNGTSNGTAGHGHGGCNCCPPPKPPPNTKVRLEVKSNGEKFERLGATGAGHRLVSYGLPTSGGGRKITSVGAVRAEVRFGKK